VYHYFYTHTHTHTHTFEKYIHTLQRNFLTHSVYSQQLISTVNCFDIKFFWCNVPRIKYNYIKLRATALYIYSIIRMNASHYLQNKITVQISHGSHACTLRQATTNTWTTDHIWLEHRLIPPEHRSWDMSNSREISTATSPYRHVPDLKSLVYSSDKLTARWQRNAGEIRTRWGCW